MTHSDHAPKSAARLPVVSSAESFGAYSYSVLRRFAQCPLSYKLQYLDWLPPDPSRESELGMLLHKVLEGVVRHHVRVGRARPIDAAHAAAEYELAWTKSDLSDPAVFADGLALVKRWVAREGIVHARDVLAVEQEFFVDIAGVRVVGAIDRVDRIDVDAIRIRDYKSSRIPSSREDVEENLQLAIYDLAAAKLWPWAKRVEVGLDLLRHDRVIAVERSEAQREATRRYVAAMAARIDAADDFPAQLTTQCTHCDQRTHCPAYAEALANAPLERSVDESDLPAVARAREELAARIKILDARKDALDAVLSEHLATQDVLEVAGRRYRLVTAARKEYPYNKTLDALEDAGVDPIEAIDRLAAIDGAALKRELDELSTQLDPIAFRALKAKLDGIARWSMSTRLTSREVPQ